VIRAAGALALFAFLREHRFDTDALAAEIGLPPEALAHSENFIPVVALGRLFARAAEQTGLSDIGLRVGSRMSFDQLGLVGYLLANAETVEAGLEALIRFLHLNNNAAMPYLLREERLAVLGYEPFGPGYPGGDHLTFGSLAIVTNALRGLCGPEFRLRAVTFAYAAPPDRSAFRRFFGAPVTFDDERSAITFDAAWLARRIPGADATLRRLIERQIRLTRPPRGQPAATDQVQRVVRTLLLAGSVSEEQVARAFGMNRRTLARRLKDAGTTFQEQLDDARSDAARSLLANSGATVASIATRLGYVRTASFSRAFRRWEGTTPGRWRRGTRRP
jgi:AraC-like DNA-binding protein